LRIERGVTGTRDAWCAWRVEGGLLRSRSNAATAETVALTKVSSPSSSASTLACTIFIRVAVALVAGLGKLYVDLKKQLDLPLNLHVI
jgi:hypothetical protein